MDVNSAYRAAVDAIGTDRRYETMETLNVSISDLLAERDALRAVIREIAELQKRMRAKGDEAKSLEWDWNNGLIYGSDLWACDLAIILKRADKLVGGDE